MEVLENYYEKGLLKINPSDLYNGTAFNRLIDNALKDTYDITDLIQTKALEGANESYKNILNKAYIETSGGVYSYQESIRRALKEFAKEGIKTVHYASGKTLGIESVVRRDVVTRVNKLVGDIDLENARELGTNLVYVDQHLGARVRTPYMKNDYEAHAEWQGKVYMIDGSNEKYDNFFEKTGYGEMLGLKGINCYHGFRAFFEWEDIPKEVNKEENKKKYELFQQQRAYERKIRRLKREREIYKEFDKDKYKEVNTSLQSTYKEFDKFIDDNNLRRDYSREYINFNKNVGLANSKANTLENHPLPKLLEQIDISNSKKIEETILKYEKIIKNDIIENAIVITKEGKVYQCFGNETNVWPDYDLKDELFNAIVTHNHPRSNYSFSNADISLFEKYGLKILRGVDEKYRYELNLLKKHRLEIPDDYMFNEYGYEHLMAIQYAINNDIYYMRWDNA